MDSHSHGSPSAGSGSAPYTHATYAKFLWYVITAFLIFSGMIAWSFKLSTALRLRSARNPAWRRPAATSWIFTFVSIFREISYGQIQVPFMNCSLTSGNMLGCTAYLIVLFSLLLNRVYAPGAIGWESIALRSAYLTVAQLPLLVVLSTKRNIVAFFLRTSYERLNVYHKLISYCTLITATLHMGYFLREWLYYNVFASQWQEMGKTMLVWGFVGWGLLVLIALTSIPFFRHKQYELWLIGHVISMLAFFVIITIHLEPGTRNWVYASVSIWAFDRIVRFAHRSYINLDLRNKSLSKGTATFEVLSSTATKITIPRFRLVRKPGQHVYLTIRELGISSHPFTVISTPESSNLSFIVKAKAGLTKAIHTKASTQLPPNEVVMRCIVDGPYGGRHTPFQSFDSVVLIAGGVGATFTMSLLQDLAFNPGCCKRIECIWVVKSAAQFDWFSEIISQCQTMARQNNVELSFTLYVTCDETFTASTRTTGGSCKGSYCCCRETIDQKASERYLAASGELEIVPLETVRKVCCCSKPPISKLSIESISGRPNIYAVISKVLVVARGETGIAVCGPTALTSTTRAVVVRLSDTRAAKKGTGAEAIYLHCENAS